MLNNEVDFFLFAPMYLSWCGFPIKRKTPFMGRLLGKPRVDSRRVPSKYGVLAVQCGGVNINVLNSKKECKKFHH
jgi:hypothetical protein